MGTWIVLRRELSQYFTSLFAYVIAFAILLLTGILFNRELTVSMTVRPANPALVPSVLSFMLIFFAPLLTMRLFAEEKREGTLELLLTAPVQESGIVFGKFLGAWSYYTIVLLLTFTYQFILASITPTDIGHAFSAYIGIWLYGGAMLAIGIFFSALTENQIVASFLSMITLLILWLGDQAGLLIANIEVARFVRNLSLQGNFSTSFAAGLVRGEDIAFFAGVIIVMLYVTIHVVESNRWR
ncbi:MAG: ABC transporter permease [Chloroflexi bacterium]|nr:ABC transporter permease [Chloroflexota bacterium]